MAGRPASWCWPPGSSTWRSSSSGSTASSRPPPSPGLFAWDGALLPRDRRAGLPGAAPDAIRFHPLLPVHRRQRRPGSWWSPTSAACWPPRSSTASWSTARRPDLARRSATLVGLAPPAFALVWAYAEGPFLAPRRVPPAAAARRRRWWLAAARSGCSPGSTRPSGLLLAVPAAVEAVGSWRAAPGSAASVASGSAGRRRGGAGRRHGRLPRCGWTRAIGDWAAADPHPGRDFRGGFVLPPVRLVEGLGEVVDRSPRRRAAHPLRRPLGVCWCGCAGAPAARGRGRRSLATVTVHHQPGGRQPELDRALRLRHRAAARRPGGGRRGAMVAPGGGVCVLGLFGMTTLAWYGEYVP